MASPAAILTILVEAQTGRASTQLRKFNAEVVNSGNEADKTSKKIGGKLAKAVKLVGLAAGVGAAYGLYKAVDAGASFERQMSSLGSVSGATTGQMKAFEKQALKLGESTQYTANQVAEAQTELAKGGLGPTQILGGALPAALDLAAAGQLELAAAAETTVNAMHLFGLEGKDTMDIANGLATAANRTTADVSDFAEAIKYGGVASKLAGYSFNETLTVLEALAEAGIKGSMAGTTLKDSVIQLLKPSKEQAGLQKELGLEVLTSNGHLKNAAGLSVALRKAVEGKTKAERTAIFATLGGTRGLAGLNAMYEEGPKALEAFERANAKQGTAAKVAGEKMNNLQGDWEQFTGALETGGIKLYQVLKGPLRSVVQWLGGAAQTLDNFDYASAFGEVKEFVTKTVGEIEEFASRYETALTIAGTALAAFAAAWLTFQLGLAITGAIDAVIAAVMGLVAAFGALDAVLFANPITLVAAAIVAVGVAGFVAYEKVKWFREAVDEAYEAMVPIAAKAKEVGEALLKFGNARLGPITVKEALLGLISPIALIALHFEAVKGVVVGALAGMIKAVEAAISWIVRAEQNVTGFVKALYPVKALLLAAKMAFLALKITIGPLLVAITEMIRLVLTLTPLVGAAARIIGTVFVAALHVAGAVIQSFLKFVGNIGSVLGDVIGVVSNLLRGKWGNAWKDAKQLVVDVWHTIEDVIKGGWTILTTTFTEGLGAIKPILKIAFGGIKHTFENIADFIGTVFEDGWKKAEGVFTTGANAIIGVINAIIDAIDVIPGVNIKKIGQLGESSGGDKKNRGSVSGGKKHRSAAGYQVGGFVHAARGALAATVPGTSTGDQHLLALNGKPIAKVESREGIFVGNRNMMGALQVANDAVPRFQQGGALPGFISGGDVIGGITKGIEVAGKVATNPGALLAETATSAADVIGKLPSGGGIPEPFSGVGPYLVEKAKDYIKNLPGSIFGSGPTRGSSKGPNGVGSYMGVPMADWVIESLRYAAGHGSGNPQPTSGYRPPDQVVDSPVVAPQGHSEHQGTQYPHGAVDFGAPYDPAALVKKMAVVNATKAFRYPLLAPIGFRDDGHASGTGHKRGGFLGRALQFLQSGGAVVRTAAAVMSRNGLDLESISGVMGNSYQESGWDTEAMEPGTHNGGMFGFTSGDKSLSALEAYAAQRGTPWGDTETQVQFMLHTLPGSMRSAMNGMSSLEDTTRYFMKNWEGPRVSTENFPRRVEGAKKAYAQLKGEGAKGGHLTKEQETAGTFKENVPAEWHGCKTGSLSLGSSTPKSLEAIIKELNKRHLEVEKYRRVADKASSEKKPAIAHAIQQNVTALEVRIRELDRARAAAKREAAKQKFTRHLGKALGKLTGSEQGIELLEHTFAEQQETAEHIVDLEPTMPEFPESMPNLAKAFKEQQFNEQLTDYIEKQEKPAFMGLFGLAAQWRDKILRSEHVAAGDWAAKGPLGGLEGNWENQIFKVAGEIQQIEALEKKAPEDLQKAKADVAEFHEKHGKEAELPDWLEKELQRAQGEVKEAHKEHERLPMLSFREHELRKFLGEAQEEFYPGGSRISANPTPPNRGTGTLEGLLENVQGIHWPGLHEYLGKLPTMQDAHGFGGIIWGLQEQLKELGLRLPGAVQIGESEFAEERGGSAGGEGGSFVGESGQGNSFSFESIFGPNWDEEMQNKVQHAQEVAQKSAEYWEEQTRIGNQRNAVFTRQSPIIDAYVAKNFAGMFAKGGSIPAGKWGIAGEAGPEPVFGPATVISNAAASAAGPVSVEVHNYGDETEVLVNGMKAVAAEVYDHKSRAGGRGAKSIGARNKGRIG